MKQTSLDYWACIRDKEEVLIGILPMSSEEEVIGIFSTNPTVVKYFSQQVSFFTSKGEDIVPE
jgi:hypothetical protein